jgi:hypothetical protein
MKTDVECELFELGLKAGDFKAEALKVENQMDALLIHEHRKTQDRIKTMGDEIKVKIETLTLENKHELVEIYKFVYQAFVLLYEKHQDESLRCSDRISVRNDQIQILK